MEENKVATRDKLAAMRLPEDKHASAYPQLGYKWADAILQSPDLRVTIVEPPPEPKWELKYLRNAFPDLPWRVYKDDDVAASFLTQREASDWMTSKEPK